MLTRELMSMLRCPTCRDGELRLPRDLAEIPEQGELVCAACDATYSVRHGVPVLIPDAQLTGEDWELWSEHLEKFQARRDARIMNPDDAVTKFARAPTPHPRFAEFAGISEGRVLDVGCGPGKFRHNLDLTRVEYVGLDPIALPEVTEFPFVQGLAETLPFTDATFTDVVVLSALDHFRDPETFFLEARRVLGPGGRLHIMQSVHEVRGPLSAVKMIGHKLKDALEERTLTAQDAEVPKHLAEFTTRSLLEQACASFDVQSIDDYAATWYSPTKLFLSFTPSADVVARSA